MSFPLPDDHWLYAPNEYRDGEHEPIDLPKPVLTRPFRDAVVAAVRYAVRGATMRGQETDFDPDALVQNAVYALCGPYTTPPQRTEQEPVCPDCKAEVLYECVACSSNNYPPQQEKALQTLHAENERLGLYRDAYTEQEPVAVKRMKEWVEFLKRQSDNGQHMNIPSSFGAGTSWELAIELEQFINTHPPQRTERNFCERCGKRTPDLITIHTCTPPKENT
jgi:hypothetical protein